jgi:hypothetical protein
MSHQLHAECSFNEWDTGLRRYKLKISCTICNRSVTLGSHAPPIEILDIGAVRMINLINCEEAQAADVVES